MSITRLQSATRRTSEQFVPRGSDGPLHVVIHLPLGGRPRARIVFCPPFAEEQRRARTMLLRLAEQLASAGHAVIAYDPFGHGDSGGEVDRASPERLMSDLSAVAAHPALGGRLDAVVGLRFGAAIAVEAVAHRLVAPRQLALVAPVLRAAGVDALATLCRQELIPLAPRVVMTGASRAGGRDDALEAARARADSVLVSIDDAPFWAASPHYVFIQAPSVLATLLDLVSLGVAEAA